MKIDLSKMWKNVFPAHKIFGNVSHYLFSNRPASRKEYIIEFSLKKYSVFFSSSHYNRNIMRFETFLKYFAYHLTCIGRICTGFYNGCVTCRNGICQRVDRQQKRIIPRTHNQRTAKRYRLNITVRRELCDRRIHGLSF